MKEKQRHLPLNITIPVFNRPELTERTVLAVREHTRLPHVVTAVDNGSGVETKTLLLDLRKKGYIHRLYRLDANYGVACASNLGWRMLDAPLYMKLDNDIEIISDTWLHFLLERLERLNFAVVMGGDFHNQLARKEYVESAEGDIGRTKVHVSGGAIVIPKCVSDIVGYWCEDYGIYGCEDGDYGMRLNRMNIGQYYFRHKEYMKHIGNDYASYVKDYDIEKKEVQKKFRKYFATNAFLVAKKLRPSNIPLRYKIKAFDGYHVEMTVCRYALDLWKSFQEVHRINNSSADVDSVTRALKKFMLVQKATWKKAIDEASAAYDAFKQ